MDINVNGHLIRDSLGSAYDDASFHLELIETIGVPWDGVSDITSGDRIAISAQQASLIIEAIDYELAALGDTFIQPLSPQALRWTANSKSERPTIVIDVDIGGVVLPFSSMEIPMLGPEADRVDQFASDIAYHVNTERKHRARLVEREPAARASLHLRPSSVSARSANHFGFGWRRYLLIANERIVDRAPTIGVCRQFIMSFGQQSSGRLNLVRRAFMRRWVARAGNIDAALKSVMI